MCTMSDFETNQHKGVVGWIGRMGLHKWHNTLTIQQSVLPSMHSNRPKADGMNVKMLSRPHFLKKSRRILPCCCQAFWKRFPLSFLWVIWIYSVIGSESKTHWLIWSLMGAGGSRVLRKNGWWRIKWLVRGKRLEIWVLWWCIMRVIWLR